MNRISRSAAAVLLSASFFLVGCGSTSPDTTPPATAYPVAGSTTSSPAAETPGVSDPKPLDIDVDKAIAESGDPKLGETFPEDEFDTREGVRFGLNTYANLVNASEFYHDRDTSQDWNLVNDKAPGTSLTAGLSSDIKAGIGKYGRAIIMPNADSTGDMGWNGNDETDRINPVLGSHPDSTWDVRSIKAGYDKTLASHTINIEGHRSATIENESGRVTTFVHDYIISVVPSGNGGWLVSDIQFPNASATATSN